MSLSLLNHFISICLLTIPDAEQQIKTEAVRQQLQEVSPELQSNLDQEVELERQIQEAEDADNLTQADELKEQITQVKDAQTELIKKQKTQRGTSTYHLG